jgi:hypothetical protein
MVSTPTKTSRRYLPATRSTRPFHSTTAQLPVTAYRSTINQSRMLVSGMNPNSQLQRPPCTNLAPPSTAGTSLQTHSPSVPSSSHPPKQWTINPTACRFISSDGLIVDYVLFETEEIPSLPRLCLCLCLDLPVCGVPGMLWHQTPAGTLVCWNYWNGCLSYMGC